MEDIRQPTVQIQKGKKILLVEDEFYLRDIYSLVLTQGGYDVHVAINGPEGLEKAQEHPDLILLDIMLPLLNGLEVLKKLKKDPQTQNIPVVLITNLGQQEIIEEAFQDGAQGYVLKVHIKPEELIHLVEKFLQNPTYKMDITALSFD